MAKRRLPDDFKEFLKLLNDHEVRYLLVGGHALGAHGHPRNTNDIDIWVEMAADNAIRVVNALRVFGFDDPSLSAEAFLKPKSLVRMGRKPLQIEIHTSISGVEFAACYLRKVVARLDDLDVPVIDLHDLIANKRAAGRPKDLADLDALGSA